jgi:hypothetical protein
MGKFSPLVAAVFVSAGCTVPSDRQIESEFRARHPGCELLSAETGEGDSDNVYVTFAMRCPGHTGRPDRLQALYQRVDGRWVVKSEMPVMTHPTSR